MQFFNNWGKEGNLRHDDYNLNQALLFAQIEWRVKIMTAADIKFAYDFVYFNVIYNSPLVTLNDNLGVMEFIDYSLFCSSHIN